MGILQLFFDLIDYATASPGKFILYASLISVALAILIKILVATKKSDKDDDESCPQCEELRAQLKARDRQLHDLNSQLQALKDQLHELNDQFNRFSAQNAKAEPDEEVTIRIPETIDGCSLVYQYEDVAFRADMASYSRELIGQRVELITDKNRAAVMHGDTFLGLFESEKLVKMIQDFERRSEPVYAVASNISASEGLGHLHLAFYRNQLNYYQRRQPDAKIYTLTGNKDPETQQFLMFCEAGEVCEIKYDYDKCKYIVSGSFDYGYLPAAAGKLVEEIGEDKLLPIITETDIGDDDKYYARVALFLK